jgi:hypothetical protein
VEEKGIFDIALGTLCDFGLAVGRAISESSFFEHCLTVLLQHLRSDEVGFNAKAATVRAVGELVLATDGGAGFIYATAFLNEAMKIDSKVRTWVTTSDNAEEDAVEVWSALIETCSVFVQTFKCGAGLIANLGQQALGWMPELAVHVGAYSRDNRNEELLCKAIVLLGDFAMGMIQGATTIPDVPAWAKGVAAAPAIFIFIQACEGMSDENVVTRAQWARTQLAKRE